jgi:hypothetical protein
MVWEHSAFDELPVINLKFFPVPQNRKIPLEIKNYKNEEIIIKLQLKNSLR